MITFQKNKKNFLLTEKGIKKIKQDIEGLTKLPIGIYAKSKEFDFAYYIKITVSKNNIYVLLPDEITFLIVLDVSYPNEPPKIFCQTNVSKNLLIIFSISFAIQI